MAMCRGSRSIACLARTLPVLCARRTLPWVRVALTAHHHTRGTTVPSQQRDELALGLGIPLDVALGHGQAGMAGELLDIPEAPSDLRHFACGARNEGPASGVRRAAVHLQRGIEPMEPQAHGGRGQPTSTLGEEDRPVGGGHGLALGL